MRHRYQGKKLNRDTDHRRALMRNLVRALVEHEKTVTTQVKAKVLQRHFERLMTVARKDSLAARRRLLAELQDRKLVQKAIQLAKKNFQGRSSGFTRLIPQAVRRGDGTLMAKVALVVPSEIKKEEKPAKKEDKKGKKSKEKKDKGAVSEKELAKKKV